MNAYAFDYKIKDNFIKIPKKIELGNIKEKDVKVIILVDEYTKNIDKSKNNDNLTGLLSLQGALEKFKNPRLRRKEKDAWEIAVKEKL